jgi:hypothetical protein
MNLLKKLRKALVLVLSGLAFLAISFMGYTKYVRHVPLEPVGACIIMDLNQGNEGTPTELVMGKVLSNNFKEGFAVVEVNVYNLFTVPVEASYEGLRLKGYIKVNCEEVK